MCLVDHSKIMSEYEATKVITLLGLSPNFGSHECLGVPPKAFVAAIERYRCKCVPRPLRQKVCVMQFVVHWDIGGLAFGVGCACVRRCASVGRIVCALVTAVVVVVEGVAVIVVPRVVIVVAVCGSSGGCGGLLMVIVAPSFRMGVVGLIAVVGVGWVLGDLCCCGLYCRGCDL